MSTDVMVDWAALRHTAGPVPWDAIEKATAALAEAARQASQAPQESADADHQWLWDEFADRYEECTEDSATMRTFECLYIPAIAVLAARQIGEGRYWLEIVQTLVDWLDDADDCGDDWDLEWLNYACQRLGPAIAPLMLARLHECAANRAAGNEWDASIWSWAILDGVIDEAPINVRVEARQLAVEQIRRAAQEEDGSDDIYPSLLHAALRLGDIRELESPLRVLTERACEYPIGGLMLGDYEEAMDFIQTGRPLTPNRPLRSERTWLEEQQKLLRAAYVKWDAEKSSPSTGDTESDDASDWDADPVTVAETELATASESDPQPRRESQRESQFDLPARWAQEFAAAHPLPAMAESAVHDAALTILQTGFFRLPVEPPNWTEREWRDTLLHELPRYAVLNRAELERLGAILVPLARWLGNTGYMPGAAAMPDVLAGWQPEMIAAALDPAKWSVSKAYVMRARLEGRPGSTSGGTNANLAILSMFSARSAARKESLQTMDWRENQLRATPVETYVRADPKVGRNDPCPCGSGKKYKRCCGG